MTDSLLLRNEEFNINKFLVYSIDENLIVQTPAGITKISDQRIIEMIMNWDMNAVQKVSKRFFEDLFAEDAEEAILFLEDYKIIEQEMINEHNITGITIVSDEEYIGSILYDRLGRHYENKLTINIISPDNLSVELMENQFIIYLQLKYDKKRVNTFLELRKKLGNTISIMGYTYSNNFYLDCLYNPTWKLPCHICHMGHIQSAFYSGYETELSYQMMIDLIYQESNNSFIRGIPLTPVQEMNIACLIINKVVGYLGNLNESAMHQQDINKSTMLNLETLKKSEDTAIYWEMCDCYE